MSGPAKAESSEQEDAASREHPEGTEAAPQADPLGVGAEESGEDDAPDGALGGSEGRGHDGRVVTRTVLAKNSFSDSYIRVEGDFVIGDDARLAVPFADITQAVARVRDRFVEPDYYPRLVEALTSRKVVLLAGPASGKRTTAAVALRFTEHDPVLQFPSDMTVRGLVDAIKRVCKKSPTAGIVIESLDSKTLGALTGFELDRLEEVVTGGTGIVLTAKSLEGAPPGGQGIAVFECSSPSLQQIIEKSGEQSPARDAALRALELLEGHVLSPSDALALLARARESDQAPDELAEEVAGKSTDVALDQWLSTERLATQVASLAAAAALDGASSVDVDRAADRLTELLVLDVKEPEASVKTFGNVDRGWPAGMVTTCERPVGTHFGYHDIESIELCPPHTRDRVVAHLWRCLGPDFRGPYVQWLRALATDRRREIRQAAAITAGVLLAVDPVVAERDLIKPWALDQGFSKHLCAAIALGAPVAIGADPAGARALAKSWSNSSDLRLRHVAVLAYGGLLGAWDPGSAAAVHLWRIATETPELERAASISLASLTAAGAGAGRVRATVLSVLSAQLEIERVPRRVYALLPLILRHLTAPSAIARESLRALLDEPEENESFLALAKLLARAFAAPSGYASAQVSVELLLRAMADGRLEQRATSKIISEMRALARGEHSTDTLDAQLERALWANARRRIVTADAAKSILNEFFPSS